MTKIKWKKRAFALSGIWLGLVILGGLVLLSNVAFADLSTRSIGVEDLPEGAKVLTDERVEMDDTSHPISLVETPSGDLDVPENRKTLYEYKAAYSFSAFAQNESVFIANFTYQYSSQLTAYEAAKLMIEDIQNSPTYVHELPIDVGQDKAVNLYGQAFALASDEGDSVYWFIGVKDDTMSLVVVNGFDESTVNDVFYSIVQNLMIRLAR